MQCSTNFFQIMFRSVSILFCCIFVPFSYVTKEEGRMVKKERNHLLRRSTGQRRKHTQDIMCHQKRICSQTGPGQPATKKKISTIALKKTCCQVHLCFSPFPQIAPTVCEVTGYKPYGQACCQIHLCFGLFFLFFSSPSQLLW